jgi:hypothetical protein
MILKNLNLFLLVITLSFFIFTLIAGCSGGGGGGTGGGDVFPPITTSTAITTTTPIATSTPGVNPTGITSSTGIVAELDLSSYGRCEDTLADGNFTYVAMKDGGVVVVNTSNPGKPLYVNKIKTYGEAWELYKEGNYLYVADKAGGMTILDVSDPNAPKLAGRDNPSGIHGDAVYKSGNYAYWVGGDGGAGYFMATDVSNPLKPVNKVMVPLFGGNSGSSIWAEGEQAYVGDARGNFYVINIFNPLNPALQGGINAVDNSSSAYDLVKKDKYIYLANGSQGLCIIDVSTPQLPRQLGKLTLLDAAYDCKVDDRYAYVAYSWGGFVKVDISDPSKPIQVSNLADPSNASFHSVSLCCDYAYLADNGRHYLVVVKYK